MEFNESTYNFFDDYLSGNCSEGDEREFENSLGENDSLREEFAFYSSAVNAIQMSGSGIFKKQVAEIGRGIPAAAFEKYSPSIKPENFFRKYWWALATASAMVIASGYWFVLKHNHPNEQNDENVVPMIDSVKKTHDDSVDKNTAAVSTADSCPTDSESPKGGKPNGAILFAEDGCRSFLLPVFEDKKNLFDPIDDSAKSNEISATSSWNDYTLITVDFCPQNSRTAFYSFSGDIRLCASYADSSNIRLYKKGKGTIIMTDGKPGFFTLIQGASEKVLVRQSYSKNKKENRRAVPESIDMKVLPQKKGRG